MSDTLNTIADEGGPPEAVIQEHVVRMHHEVFDAVASILTAVKEGLIDEVRLTKDTEGNPAVQVIATSVLGKQGFQYGVPKTAETFMQVLVVAGAHVDEEIAKQVQDPERKAPWMDEYAIKRRKLIEIRHRMAKGKNTGIIIPRAGRQSGN